MDQLGARSHESLLRGLTAAQRDVVTCDSSPLCVIAGAGSGKTRVLTTRVARRVLEGSADPKRTLVLTFTRKAADELRMRLLRLGVPEGVKAGTFHAIAYSQLRRYWSDVGRRPPAVVGDSRRIVRKLLAESEGRPDPALVSAIASEISWARARSINPDSYRAAARTAGRSGTDPQQVEDVYLHFSEYKARRGVLDLDDLIEKCAQLLEDDQAFGAAQRWLNQHLYVDELQDLNSAQWRLLRGWLKTQAGRGGADEDLFVVGDPLQAIYSWNGSDPGYLSSIEKLVPGISVMHLGENHRCAPQVLGCAKAALGPLDPGSHLRSARHDHGDRVEVAGFESDATEAIAVARWLRRLHGSGVPWARLAVLARTNARLDPIQDALASFGIPFARRNANADLQRDATTSALSALHRATPLRRALAELASDPELDTDLEALGNEIDTICAEVPDADVAELLSRRAALGEPDPGSGPGTAWRRERRRPTSGVTLSTFHGAKGLEWCGVAVIGLEALTVPIAYATKPVELDEERRLLYVAMTRAEDSLWCSWAFSRTTLERTFECEPSPYIPAVLDAASSHDGLDPVPPKVRISELRSVLSSTAS